MIEKSFTHSRARMVSFVFGAVAVVLMISALVERRSLSRTLGQVEDIVDNSLESVRLLEEIEGNFERQLRLVESHVFEATLKERLPLEQELERSREQYRTLAAEYSHLVTFPGESELWVRLQGDVRALQPPIDKAVGLSRADRDDEARAVIRSLEPPIEESVHDIRQLVALNTQEARQARNHVRELLRAALFAGLLAWGLVIAMTVGSGVVVDQLLARLDARDSASFAVLENRNRELDTFAGRVAHDLRGPLTVINSAATLLDEQPSTPRGGVASIRRGVARMNAIMTDLLQLSQIEGAPIRESCDAARAVSEYQENAAESLSAAGAQLRVEVVSARIGCRDGLFRQLVTNLAENALKYRRNEVKPEMQIVGRIVGASYELRVSDNGIGMSKEEAERAFDPLYRARRQRNTPGTGLGLSIVKRIVEAAGGSVSIESKLGKGTTVVVKLPLRTEEATPMEPGWQGV